jgi:peptidoglycan biosynthesis protein MviN/MurJ (putative lipid II flippase)
MHAAWIPALIALCATALNIILNILFIERFQALGLAYATTCCAIAQTGIFLLILKKKYAFNLYEYAFFTFALRYIAQLSIFSILFYISYNTIHSLITQHAPANIVFFFTHNIGLWFWVAPLAAFFCLLLWITRSFFKIKLYFLP